MKKISYSPICILVFLVILICQFIFLAPKTVRAQQNDWIIRDFKSFITLNTDNTLKIVEEITADCGDLSNKHGIFRTIPMKLIGSDGQEYKNPIYLESITDFEGKPYNYNESVSSDSVITWKIGDSDIIVRGVNHYKIVYLVKNVIRGNSSPAFDELYWNLNGNFWQIPIMKYSANITFPQDIQSNQSSLSIYSGKYGNDDAGLVEHYWKSQNEIEVVSTRAFQSGEGVTISLSFPKNIVSTYELTREDEAKIAGKLYLSDIVIYFLMIVGLVLPFMTFFVCFNLWKRYGKDPKINRTVVPEFDIPDKLAPIEMDLILRNGSLSNTAITAGIVALATKGYLKIEEIVKKNVLSTQDYKLIRVKKSDNNLQFSEKIFLEKLFKMGDEVLLSSYKDAFYKEAEIIKNRTKTQLSISKLIDKRAENIVLIFYLILFLVYTPILFFISFFVADYVQLVIGGWGRFMAYLSLIGLGISFVVALFFSFIMSRRPLEGLIMYQRIRGFQMFMRKAEKYRQPFLEHEGFFERLLPYAILFGITKKWMRAMQLIYGQQFMNNYAPVWFYGSAMTSLNFDDFSNHLNSMTSNMYSKISSNPSSSGSGGGGFSGGGGGGGGGGGW